MVAHSGVFGFRNVLKVNILMSTLGIMQALADCFGFMKEVDSK